MKRQQLAICVLGGVLGALSLSVLSACTPFKSLSESLSQAKAGSTAATSSTEPNPPSSAERAQKRAAVLKQIETVLTPEQIQQLQTKLKQGEKMRVALRELNLKEDQKTKIREILKAAYPHRNLP
jgi:Spy/CpxP family protein refolding chaperone